MLSFLICHDARRVAVAVLLLSAIAGYAEPSEESAIVRRQRSAFMSAATRSADLEYEQWMRRQEVELAKEGRYPAMSMNATLLPFADWDYYFVDRGSITWRPNPGQSFKEVSVPAGFVTDLASIPRAFWIVLRPEGRYAYAAVVHDFLYWTQDRTREEADLIFKTAMEDSDVGRATVYSLYYAVRRFGQGAWDANAALKRSGEKRMLMQFPKDFKATWQSWKTKPGVFDIPEAEAVEEVPPAARLRPKSWVR